MIRRLFMICAASALLLAGCDDQAAPDRPQKRDSIAFSILSTERTSNLQTLWDPFLKDMEAQTGLDVRAYFGSNYTALIEAMNADQVQVGWFSNQSGLQAVRRADAEVFARSTDVSGVDGYTSVLIVKADSPLTLEQVLRCDRTLEFGIGDVQSTSGTLAPMTYLFAPRNIDPQRCFRLVRTGNHEANLLAVANGVLDVATNNSTAMERADQQQAGFSRRVKVIWRSPLLPEDPIVWRKDLDPAVKERVRQFFLTYGTREDAEGARQRRILNALNFGVFRPADNNHLLPVREMEATEQLLRARNGGKPAEIARAQQALDAIRQERAEVEARAGEVPAP